MSDAATQLEFETPQPAPLPQDEPVEIQQDPDAPPIEIAEDEHQEPEQETAPVEQPKKKISRRDARVENATHAAAEATRRAEAAEHRAAVAEARAAEAERQRTVADDATIKNHEAWLKSERDRAKALKVQSRQSGDVNAEMQADEVLAVTASKLADLEALKESQKSAPPPEQPRQQPQQQQPQFQPLSEPVQDWMSENSWFHPFQMGNNGLPLMQNGRPIANPDFDAEMHDAAMLVHKKLAHGIKAGRYDIKVESPEYFQAITDELNSMFGDEQEAVEIDPAPQPRRIPMSTNQRQPVAPATRTGVPGQNNGRVNPNKVTLPAEHAAMAISLRDSGVPAYKYQPGHAKAGQKMSDRDAYMRYHTEYQREIENEKQRRA